jgi:hypothetical protein
VVVVVVVVVMTLNNVCNEPTDPLTEEVLSNGI